MRALFGMVMAGALAGARTGAAAAQEVGARAATLRIGGLMYDRGGDATNPMFGAGVDWTLSRHVLAEVEGTWSAANETVLDFSTNEPEPPEVETKRHLATLTAGLQAQALLGRVRPYAGMAAGLFVLYDAHDAGDRFPRYTVAFPVGVRVDLTQRLGLRGELRGRFDTHQDGGSGTNVEQTLGLSLRF